ncbi:MAG: hypothetical protein KAS72_08480, partial [Phycisphaerales bacterium]|nr:hypothetical protein [Phycisphaerales bacterium]
MADSVRHKTLLSILDALLIVGAAGAVATGGASLVVLGGAAFIASITKRFRALPADEKEILRGVTTAQLRDALMQVGLGTEHAAAAHAGVLRIEEQITSLREAMGKIAEDGRHDGDREIARRLAGQLDELHEAAERAQKSLSRIERVLTAGLVSVSDFEERYWDNTLGSLPLDRIRKDPEKVKLLKSVFAGRNRELFQLAGFLTDATSQTMHIHGSPGNGKSRLVLEIAHRAQAVGWIVLFVDSAISDFALHAALETVRNVLREAEPAHVLLVWDDYQGENQDQLRTFLRLHTSPEMWSPFKGQTVGESHTPLRVKRLVTSWLAFSGAVAQHADPKDVTWAKGMELPPLRADDTMGITAFVDLMCELGDDTQFTREDMEQLLVQAEGHPQVALLGVDLLLGGEPLTAALNRPSILRSSYGRVVKRLMDELDGEHLEAFRTLAFIQRCSRDSLEWFAIGANCDQFLKQLGRLREAGFVRRDNDKTYFVYPDIQRMYMCTASFEPDGPLGGLDAPPADIAAQLRPFIPVWLPPIWSLVQSALPPDGEQIAEIKDRLLTIAEEAIGQSTSGEKTHQRDEQWSRAMFAMTVIEAIPRDRRQWARMIGVIANRHESPSTKIDLEWVRALFNATAGETDPNVCREIAREIGVIANRHEPPSAEIDLRWAKALCSATVGQPDPNVCREIAREISVIADR